MKISIFDIAGRPLEFQAIRRFAPGCAQNSKDWRAPRCWGTALGAYGAKVLSTGTFKFMVGNASVPHLCIICGQTSLALILFDSLLPILLA